MKSSKNALRVGIVTPVQSFDPRDTGDFVNILVLWQIFETPYAPTFVGQRTKPLLLKEPPCRNPSVGDHTAFSAVIQDGVKFSDGTPMTAQHVASSLRQNKAFSLLVEAKAMGDRVFFFLKHPQVRLDLALTPLNRAVILEKRGALLGTGAYVPTPDSTPYRIRLVRNPYYRSEVAISEIEFMVFPREKDGRAEKLHRAVKEGQVDFTTFLQQDEIRNLDSVRKSIELGTSTALLYFNVEHPSFHDPKVRKAVALAIDRKAIAQLFYSNPIAYAATGILPPVMDRLPDGIEYDLDKAKTLMAESGFKPPDTPLRLLTIWGPRPYLPRPLEAAAVIAGQMSKLGLEVRVEPANSLADYFKRTSRGDYDLVLAGWIPDTPDPADFLEVILSSASVPDSTISVMTGINLSRFKSSSMDDALKCYRTESSEHSKAKIIRLLRDETPLLPLMYGPVVVVHTWRLTNYPKSFFKHPIFSAMKLRY